jgi:hypothetical protein
MRRHPLPLLAALCVLLSPLDVGPARAQHPGQRARQAVFATRAEAEAAAKPFNCQGAHRMGDQWMPCASHGDATGGQPGQGAR